MVTACIVMPCLNEEKNLRNTCLSLGFGSKDIDTPENCILIIVDNGSIDGSLKIAQNIKEQSPDQTVFITNEYLRGYVPPRHKGNLTALEIARKQNIQPSDILVVQADADTIYWENYVDSLRNVSSHYGSGIFLEGCVGYPENFKSRYSQYIDLCNEIDSKLEELFVDYEDDVIIDDKVCSYRLEDYFKWRGLQQEYNSKGEEIHAGTSRLFMKAKASGATKLRVEDAFAEHSVRKILVDPAIQFATAGFTRESSWIAKWKESYVGPKDLDDFCKDTTLEGVQKAIKTRILHVLALFCILPRHILITERRTSSLTENSIIENLISRNLPKRNLSDLVTLPSVFMEDTFSFIDYSPYDLINIAFKFFDKFHI